MSRVESSGSTPGVAVPNPNRIEPSYEVPGAFRVVAGDTEQSWVDPSDPLRLEFEYVQRIAAILDLVVVPRPATEQVRVVHLGGGGLTLPRYLATKRPRTIQIVAEPDAALVEALRTRLPNLRRSGIRIRTEPGRQFLATLPDHHADAVIVDAFAEGQVPAEMATAEFFSETARVLRPGGVVIMNLTDQAPFDWAKRCIAALAATQPQTILSAEPPVWRGRRFGNLVALSGANLPQAQLTREFARTAFPYRMIAGRELPGWLGSAHPFTDADSQPSQIPPWSRLRFN